VATSSAIEWASWIFVLVAVGRIAEVIPILALIPLAKITLLVWVILIAKTDRLKTGHTMTIPLARNALWLFVWAVCSVVFSIWFVASLKFVAINGFLILIAYILICKSVDGWQSLRKLFVSLVVSAELLSVMTLLSYTGGRAAFGTMYDTNDLAYLLVTMLPLSLSFIATSTGLWKIRYLGGLAVIALAILLTQSRGGVLGLGGILLFVTLFPIPLFSRTAKLHGTVAGVLKRLVAITLVAVTVWGALPSETRERFATMGSLDSDYNTDQTNLHSRSSIWQRNLSAVVARPIGFGVGAFPAVDVRNGGVFMTAHNSLVLIAVELGVIGIVLYMRMYYLAWRAMSSLQKDIGDLTVDARARKIFARAIQACLIGNFISGFFLSMSYSYVLWILMAASTAFVDTLDADTSDHGSKDSSGRRGVKESRRLPRQKVRGAGV